MAGTLSAESEQKLVDDALLKLTDAYMDAAHVWSNKLMIHFLDEHGKLAPAGLEACALQSGLTNMLDDEEPTFYDVIKDNKFRHFELRRQMAFISLQLYGRTDLSPIFANTAEEEKKWTKTVEKVLAIAPAEFKEKLLEHFTVSE